MLRLVTDFGLSQKKHMGGSKCHVRLVGYVEGKP